jgi:pimeloyl-ACP methyl ester carboxylesterase
VAEATGAEVAVIPAAAHVPHLERPGPFRAAVLPFLSSAA